MVYCLRLKKVVPESCKTYYYNYNDNNIFLSLEYPCIFFFSKEKSQKCIFKTNCEMSLFKVDTRLFFISNTFTSNTRPKLAKNQANAKQHPEAELLKIIHIFHPHFHPKVIVHILEQVKKEVCLSKWRWKWKI